MPLVDNFDDLGLLLQRTRDSKEVVVDTETNGLDFKSNHIVGYVITFGPDPADSFYWPVRHAAGNFPNPRAEKSLVSHVSQPDKTIVFHNAAFDLAMLHGQGWVRGPKIEDTMIGRYLLHEQEGQSLEECCRSLGVVAKKSQQLYNHIAKFMDCKPTKASMGEYWKMPGDDEIIVNYACGDGTSTWQLWDEVKRQVDIPYFTNEKTGATTTLNQVYDMEMELIPVLHGMRMRGVRVDEERLAHVIGKMETERDEAQLAIGDINVKSSPQVQAYLEANGVTKFTEETPKGNPSFPEKFLVQSKPGLAIMQARKRRTLLETFLYPMRDKFLHKGRVHPEFHQSRDEDFGTITGRLSSTKPNFQAQPSKRQGDLGKLVRSIFIPDEGMVWVESDYKNCELRIAAHYSGAKIWLDAFRSNSDVYEATAEKLKITRNSSKIVNLGIIMGMGVPGLSTQLDMTQGEAKIILDEFYANLPELRIWQTKVGSWFTREGWVNTLSDRRLHLPRGKKDLGFTDPNRLTQGGNADVTKAALIRMDALFYGRPNLALTASIAGQSPAADAQIQISGNLLLTVHDSISFQCEAEQMVEVVTKAMEDQSAFPLTVDLPCDGGSGINWGDATFSKDFADGWKT